MIGLDETCQHIDILWAEFEPVNLAFLWPKTDCTATSIGPLQFRSNNYLHAKSDINNFT